MAGNFVCSEENETHNLTITQADVKGVTTYKMVSKDENWEMISDGAEHDFPANKGVRDGKYKAVCIDAQKLNVDAKAKLTNERGDTVGDLMMKMGFNRGNGSLIVRTVGKAVVGDKTYPIDSTATCVEK